MNTEELIKKQKLKDAILQSEIENKIVNEIGNGLAEQIQRINSNLVIILLNAHGGINPKTKEYVTKGKRSLKWDNNPPVHNENIYYEGVGSREINSKIVSISEKLGIKSIIINDTWEDTEIWKKRHLAIETMGMIKKNNKNAKFVAFEIHSNATKEMNGKAIGFEFFTYPEYSSSDILAEILGKEYDTEFQGHKHRRTYPNLEKEARFGILKLDEVYAMKELSNKNKFGYKYGFKGIPIVLSENAFMDNEKECKEILMTDKGKYRIAKFHLFAAIKFAQKMYL